MVLRTGSRAGPSSSCEGRSRRGCAANICSYLQWPMTLLKCGAAPWPFFRSFLAAAVSHDSARQSRRSLPKDAFFFQSESTARLIFASVGGPSRTRGWRHNSRARQPGQCSKKCVDGLRHCLPITLLARALPQSRRPPFTLLTWHTPHGPSCIARSHVSIRTSMCGGHLRDGRTPPALLQAQLLDHKKRPSPGHCPVYTHAPPS